MTPTQYAERAFPPDQDSLRPAGDDWAFIREELAQAMPRDEVRCLGECARLTDADPGGCYCGKHVRADVYAALKEEHDA